MDRYRKGMLVRSKAGHDTGKVYIMNDVQIKRILKEYNREEN